MRLATCDECERAGFDPGMRQGVCVAVTLEDGQVLVWLTKNGGNE